MRTKQEPRDCNQPQTTAVDQLAAGNPVKVRQLWLFCGLAVAALLVVSESAFAGGGRNRVAGDEMSIPAAPGPVTIDGDLGDWDESTAKLFTLAGGGAEDSKSEVPLAVYSARVAFQYDREALYVAAWFNDPTPLGPQTNAGCTPAGDGLILDIPVTGAIRHVALWREPGGTVARSLVAAGAVSLSDGKSESGDLAGVPRHRESDVHPGGEHPVERAGRRTETGQARPAGGATLFWRAGCRIRVQGLAEGFGVRSQHRQPLGRRDVLGVRGRREIGGRHQSRLRSGQRRGSRVVPMGTPRRKTPR